MTTTQQLLEERLLHVFDEQDDVHIKDESHKHKGHLADDVLAQGSHFFITIHSSKFSGMRSLARHRMVYDLFNDLLRDNIVHAIRLDLREKGC